MDKLNFGFLILALLAEVIGTVGGFGSSVFFVPIGNYYFDFHSVLGMIALFHLSSNLSKIMLFRKGFDKTLILQIGIPSILFVIIGGYLSKSISGIYLELLLGFFLVSLSLLFLIKQNLVVLPNLRNSLIGGSLSGFSAGILGTGGAIRGLTMAAFNLEKSKFIATSAFIDFLIDFSRSIVYFQNGYIKSEILPYIPFLFVIGLLGSFIGKKLLIYIPQSKFRRLSLFLILIIGSITLLKYFIK